MKLALVFILYIGALKNVESTINLSTYRPYKYITKFSVAPGTQAHCTIVSALSTNISMPINPEIIIYNDKIDYEKVTDIEKCNLRKNYSVYSYKTTLSTTEWTSPIQVKFDIETQPITYYFEMVDCTMQGISRTHPLIISKIECLNGEEQFSYEEMGSLKIYALLLTAMVLLLLYDITILYKEIKLDHEYLLPLLFNISVAIFCLSLCCKLIHYYSYSNDGYGVPFFELFSIVWDVAAQLCIIVILISIAWGWMVLFKQTGDLDLYVPIFALILVAHILTGGLTYVNHDDYYKFYEYQGVQGTIIIVIRIALYVGFIVGYLDTYEKIVSTKKKFVFYKYGVYSSFFILGFPILVIFSTAFSHYYRQAVVVVGNYIVQAGSIYFCQKLFLSKGEFYQASELSKSDLPS